MVKSRVMVCLVFLAAALIGSSAFGQECATIQGGTLRASDGSLIETGFDSWGYNYQAHEFNGTYCDAYRNAAWCQPWVNDELLMKWNDAWLSKTDCDGDGLLDRHLGYASYQGSGAWLTNHQKGVYLDDRGKKQRWTYFVKIIAAPADAVAKDGFWYVWDSQANDFVAMGPAIWGEFAVVQEVYNDTGTGEHGIVYLSPKSAGFGNYGPQR